jgi:hypothetical protein
MLLLFLTVAQQESGTRKHILVRNQIQMDNKKYPGNTMWPSFCLYQLQIIWLLHLYYIVSSIQMFVHLYIQHSLTLSICIWFLTKICFLVPDSCWATVRKSNSIYAYKLINLQARTSQRRQSKTIRTTLVISGQYNVTTRIQQVQDKKNINWAAKKYY